MLECGLDNTYVYDDADYIPDRHVTSYNDVGLNSLYVMDCEYLARIASELGRRREAREISARGDAFRKEIQKLWSEEDGMFLCKAATPEQARRMVDEHLLNEDEFADNTYWRGRIWGPTNFLVYLGLLNYDFAEVRAALADKSEKLLMKDWTVHGYIYENWNAVTGEGGDVSNSDRFYHWGALLGYISLNDNKSTLALEKLGKQYRRASLEAAKK